MKNLALLTSALFMVLISFTACKKNKELVTQVPLPDGYFEDDWQGAMDAANTHDRKVFVQFYANWCTHCAAFKEEVMADEEVKTYMNDNFIVVLMDSEKDKGLERFEHFGLNGHPNVIVIDKNQNILGQHQGRMDKPTFQDWIKDYE